MFGQSAAGQGKASDVTLNPGKDVIADGLNSVAIYGQSTGTLGRGDIKVTTAAGTTILGGSDGGVGVAFVGGNNNSLFNAGTLSALSRLAITGTDGNTSVVNVANIFGSVDLGHGVNTFDNRSGAIFLAGTKVNLGAHGLLTNQGLISPGDLGLGEVMTTTVTGNFVQTPGGTYWVDVDLDPSADRFMISGTASVSGLIKLNVMNPGGATPGVHQETILSAAGGLISHAGLHLEVQHSVVADYRLIYPNGGDIVLQYEINFAPDALHCPNTMAVGNAINRIQRAGVASFQPVAGALFSLTTIDQVRAAYDSLSGEGASAVQQSTLSMRSLVFDTVTQNGTLSRAAADEDPVSWSKQRWRGWAGGYGGTFNLNGDACEAGTQTTGGGAVVGADYRLDQHLQLGITSFTTSASYSVADRATHGLVTGGGVGLYAGTRWDAFYATGSVTYGAFDNQDQREQVGAYLGALDRARGHFDSDAVGGRVEIGFNQRFGPLTLTPFAALQADGLWLHGYSEKTQRGGAHGSPDFGLRYTSQNVTSLPLSLGLQIDGTVRLNKEVTLTPYVRAAWVHEFNPDRVVNAEFQSAPGYGFRVEGARAVQESAQINAGVKFDINRRITLSLNYVGDLSNAGVSHGGFGSILITW